jgi:Leucine-rich repeat (LRR) protein/ribosomal protein L35AE/L33A
MFKARLSLLILVLMSPLTQAATDCAAVTEIPSTECEVLIALYNSTNGDSWKNHNGWNETNTPCSWYGVTCNGGHVSEIRLYNNELGGTIPTELGNLSDLTLLDLSTSWNSLVKLTGTIPTELGSLSNLTELSLSSNELTGTIPTELGNLNNLTSLYLHSNQLTGTIPTELGNLSNLTFLSLSDNDLTGTIPTELGNLSNLTSLSLLNNDLTGTIPTELGNLSNLTSLSLLNNELTGTIPTELGNLSNLTHLNLYNNELTGTIPTELGNLSNLTHLYLSNNELTGTIPTELGNLSNLSFLDLSWNSLIGTIPTELGNLSNLTFLRLSSNELTGTIPTELGNLSNLTFLRLSSNDLTGTIPTELGNLSNLTRLFLYSNQLCGEIPPELKNLTKIPLPDDCSYNSCIDIDNNHLTASDSELIEWLDTYNPGWQTTQTPCPQLQFTSATYNVNENEGQATITVTRTGSSDGAVSIDYATSDDTAKAGSDYTDTSGTLDWNDGDDADKTFSVDITDDTQQENDETFIVSLGNPTGSAQLGTPDTAQVTINANDTCTPDTYETDDTSTQARTITSGTTQNHNICPIGDKDWVKFTLSNPSAIQLETAGSTGDTRMWLYNSSLSEIEYDDDDGTDRFSMIDRICGTNELPAGTYYVKVDEYGDNNTIDNYTLSFEATACQFGTVQFSEDTYNTNEADGTINITVTRVDGSEGNISVDCNSSDGTAKAGKDYNAIFETLNWSDGNADDKICSVTIINDTTFEDNEIFNLTLENATGGAAVGDPATVTIIDDDKKPGTLQLSSATYNVNENGSSITITLTRIGGSDGTVSIDYSTSDDTATAGNDYTAKSETINWNDGETSNKTFTINITDDNISEGNETFNLTLSNATGGATIGNPDTAEITIIDNEEPCVPDTYETDDTSSQARTITSGTTQNHNICPIGDEDWVKFTLNNPSAINLETAGSTGDTRMWLYNNSLQEIEYDDDDGTGAFSKIDRNCGTDELPAGTYYVKVDEFNDDNTIDNYTLSFDATACQFGTVQFSKDTYNINEADGTADITVTRVDGSEGNISVDCNSSDGTAKAGKDYNAIFETLNWSDGNADDKICSVTIINDTTFEDNEIFNLTLENATGGATVGEPATVTIIDDDELQPGTVQFSSDTYSVDENNGTVTLKVSRINGNDGIIFLAYTSTDGSATAGEDYSAVFNTLTWTDGDASDKTFIVPILDDTIFEENETFNLTLTNATGGATIGEPSEAVVTINDNDTPQENHGTLQFSEATYNIDENGGSITIKVNRIDGSDGATSIDYATSDDTATASNDYTAKIDTLNWENGDSTDKTITIDITDDSTPENEETFIVSLANPTGGAQLGKPDTAKVTITDNDQTEKHGTLQFSKDQFTVKENVHTAEVIITVKRIEGSDGAVLVEYAASDDTAKAGSDYTYTKGGLRWEDGDDDDKTFTVPIINDDEPENDETFIVSLANPIGGAQIGSPDTATVTIKDDDKPFNCKKVSGIPKKECEALIAFYDSTDGENWTYNTGWKATNSPCSWDGITCRNQHVTGLSLKNNNLSGTVSKEFFKLKKLESLVLSDNDLNDTSLNNFKKLKNLETLSIDKCKLSGKIPNSLMKLKKLEELDLNDNCLKTKVSKKLKKWLDELNPGWNETQTDCQ